MTSPTSFTALVTGWEACRFEDRSGDEVLQKFAFGVRRGRAQELLSEIIASLQNYGWET